MKSFRRIFFVVSAVSLGFSGMFLVGSGCSSNSATPLPDGGGHDGTTTDSPAPDAHGEAGDAGKDGDGSIAPDVIISVDSGDASALFAFPGQLASALCTKLQQCCALISDGGFSLPACDQDILPYGWNGSSFGNNFLDGGKMTLNVAAATACLNDVQNIDCSANVVTSTQATALYNDCYAALQGTATSGQSCAGPSECAPGLFCALPNDGGVVGSCMTLKSNGQPCGDFGGQVAAATTPGQALALSECSYLGSGSNGLSCQVFPLDGSPPTWDPSNWSCFGQLEAGANCNFDVDCVSRRCDPQNFLCVSAVPYANANECAFYVPKDGGTD